MFGSSILEVVIGLVFIYLLYSLLATTIKEGIAAVMGLRAKMLRKAISRMLDDGFNKPASLIRFLQNILEHLTRFLKGIGLFLVPLKLKQKKSTKLVDLFYDQPGIKYLGENVFYKKPSYISPRSFSKGVMDTLKELGDDANPAGDDYRLISAGIDKINEANETKKFIRSLLKDAGTDLEKFRLLLEEWFNETMDRTTGWYKRQAQLIIFFIGLILAVTFNVDTLYLVRKLSKDKDARKSLVDVATSYAKTHKDSTNVPHGKDKEAESLHFADSLIRGDIHDATALIAIGWNVPARFDSIPIHKSGPEYKAEVANCKQCLEALEGKAGSHHANLSTWHKVKYVFCMSTTRPRKMLGFLITAIAVSLGAPFWFDLLNKLVQLRGSGKKPEEGDPKSNS